MKVDPKAFWNDKILRWEVSRYDRSSNISHSVRFRAALALASLRPRIKDKDVVEIGCGSGRLAKALIAAGARSYTGYDISGAAVQTARQNWSEPGLEFFESDVLEIPPARGKMVFSLGLLDWLDDVRIKHVFALGGESEWLHSFSENRRSLAQRAHQIFVYLSYGRFTGSYIPRYFTASDLVALGAGESSAVVRHPKLSIGAFINNFDREGLQHEAHRIVR